MYLGEYARCLALIGVHEDAEAHLLEAHAGLEAAFGTEHPEVVKLLNYLLELCEVWGNPEKAAVLREKLQAAPTANAP